MENGIATIVLGSSTPHHGNTASSSFVSTPVLDHRRDDDPLISRLFFSRLASRIGTERKRTKTTIEFANLSTIRIDVMYRHRFVTSKRYVEYRSY